MSHPKTVTFADFHNDNIHNSFHLKKRMIFVFPEDDAWYYSKEVTPAIIKVRKSR